MNDRRLLTICGVLFCVLAVSNFLKPLEFDAHTGFVFLGMRQHGTWNLVLGPLAGLFLAVYGVGVLRRRAYALPLSRIYAAYVIVNLVLFTVRMSNEALAKPIFGLVYVAIAVGVSSGCAYLLARNRALLS
jgi:uncharacterized membrane protein YhaH (DUF805 family)